MVRSAVLTWEAAKDFLSATTGLSHHDLHLILGIGLTLAIGRGLRLPLRAWRPLLIVSGLEMLNETSDYLRYRLDAWPWTPHETLIDIAITIMPPLILVLAARWRASDRRSR